MSRGFLKKNKLIISLVVVMTLMVSFVISTAAQMVSSDIKGYNGGGKWDIKFTDMKLASIDGMAKEEKAPTYFSTYASFNVDLKAPKDKVNYDITVSNLGNIDAKVDGIYILPENTSDNPIKYEISGLSVGDVLKAGESVKVTVSIYYDENVPAKASNRDANILINYVQS